MIIPEKLSPESSIRIVAPSTSMAILSESGVETSTKRLQSLGLKLSFGENVNERDIFDSSSVESRLHDLHDAFSDPSVDGILTVIGGYNCNQLLSGLDFDLIARNPKVFCGFSDITALSNAIWAKTGLVSYVGCHFSTFAQLKGFDYSMEYFKKCLINPSPFTIESSKEWSDDQWWLDQEARVFIPNPGPLVLNEGEAEGTIIGGNQCTLNLLQGTAFMPELNNTILFLEDDFESHAMMFDRDLQSIIHQPGFCGVKAILIGRFQTASNMTEEKLRAIVSSKPELKKIPVIANLDFGHTTPMFTFPVGGRAAISAHATDFKITITSH